MSVKHALKICGVTNAEDAELISAAGADYCGILVDVGFSERSLSLRQAREVASASEIPVVVLLCDPDVRAAEEAVREIEPYAVQLLSSESPDLVRELKARLPCRIWKTVYLPVVPGQASPGDYVEAGADGLMVDRADSSEGFLRLGGTGRAADWGASADLVRTVPVPVFLAGGIGPDNVERAVLEVRAFGIDLCSGVEASKGKKDPEKVRVLVDRFKAAVAKLEGGEA